MPLHRIILCLLIWACYSGAEELAINGDFNLGTVGWKQGKLLDAISKDELKFIYLTQTKYNNQKEQVLLVRTDLTTRWNLTETIKPHNVGVRTKLKKKITAGQLLQIDFWARNQNDINQLYIKGQWREISSPINLSTQWQKHSVQLRVKGPTTFLLFTPLKNYRYFTQGVFLLDKVSIRGTDKSLLQVNISVSPNEFYPGQKITVFTICKNRSQVKKWQLQIINNQKQVVRTFKGRQLPEIISWYGKNNQQKLIKGGDIFEFLLKGTDRQGLKWQCRQDNIKAKIKLQKMAQTQNLYFNLSNIEFDLNKWAVKKRSHKVLALAAKILKKYPKHRIIIAGHTDNQGEASYNLYLSRKRALAVAALLVKKFKIKKKRLKINWYGQTRPIASNKSAAGRAQNRRVEFELIKRHDPNHKSP